VGAFEQEAIKRAIAEHGFQVVYQPILDLDSGEVTGVEALSRFKDGRSPVRWFEAAEATGMAAELDLAIIEAALADLPQLPGGSYLSLNLSPSTLLEPRLSELLQSAPVPAERLVMEITEHTRVTNYGEARKTLQGLREAGISLAIDDAGAGYATFRHVLRLRPDIIKMDQSITQHIDRDQARVALATALVIFASEIGAVVIAEGVETRGELAALQSAGVSRAQGFALSRPQSLPLVLPEVRSRREPIARGFTPVAAAAESMSEYTAVSAHQLLNPLCSIELALELLRKRTDANGEDECRALISTAQRQARYVGVVLEDLVRGLGQPTMIDLSEAPLTQHDATIVDQQVP